MIVLPPGVLYVKMFVRQIFWDLKLRGVGQSFWDGSNANLKAHLPTWRHTQNITHVLSFPQALFIHNIEEVFLKVLLYVD